MNQRSNGQKVASASGLGWQQLGGWAESTLVADCGGVEAERVANNSAESFGSEGVGLVVEGVGAAAQS